MTTEAIELTKIRKILDSAIITFIPMFLLALWYMNKITLLQAVILLVLANISYQIGKS